MARIQHPEWTVSMEKMKVRCWCGRILAFVTKEGFELRCRRCARIILIPFTCLQDGREVAVDSPCSNGTRKERVIAN